MYALDTQSQSRYYIKNIPSVYDVHSAFDKYEEIEWTQRLKKYSCGRYCLYLYWKTSVEHHLSVPCDSCEFG